MMEHHDVRHSKPGHAFLYFGRQRWSITPSSQRSSRKLSSIKPQQLEQENSLICVSEYVHFPLITGASHAQPLIACPFKMTIIRKTRNMISKDMYTMVVTIMKQQSIGLQGKKENANDGDMAILVACPKPGRQRTIYTFSGPYHVNADQAILVTLSGRLLRAANIRRCPMDTVGRKRYGRKRNGHPACRVEWFKMEDAPCRDGPVVI
jgi:hypothetical protein